MRSIILISILFCLGIDIPEIKCQEDGLYNFLYNAAEAFPSWIAQNGLDPTPEMPEELSLESQGFVNVTAGKIWNQVMSGHSGMSETPRISANFLLGNFRVGINLSNFSVTSDYEVEGMVLPSTPITGAGKVTVIPSLSNNKYVELKVDGFEVTPDGYIDISAGSVESLFYFYLGPISFEGLSAGGYETEVERVLKDVYEKKLLEDSFSMFQMTDYLRSYVEELFAKTPISEIIDTTLPPTGSPTPTEETTPGLSSTSEVPCRPSVFGADGSTLLEEKVLKKIVVVKENGKKVEIVEKLVKFERIIIQ